MKKLIINADDYGLSKNYNKGIVKLIREGIVNSVSVMVGQPYVHPSELLAFQNLSIGLHLELEDKTTIEEIENQINLFKKKFAMLPSHLDGHKYCHILLDNIEVVAEVANKYDLPIRSRFKEDRNFFVKNGIKTPEKFISWHPNRISVLIEKLRQVDEGIIEMVCHPGYKDKKSPVSYNEQRESELEFLLGKMFKQEIEKFNLINYSSF